MSKKFIVIAIVVLMLVPAFAAGSRKVLVIAPAEYPSLAKQMRVEGAVKIEVVVEPSGKIRDAKVVGGHPLLIDSAMKSAKQWKFEPAAAETVETVTINYKRNAE